MLVGGNASFLPDLFRERENAARFSDTAYVAESSDGELVGIATSYGPRQTIMWVVSFDGHDLNPQEDN